VTQSLKFATACLLLVLGAFVLPSSAQTDNPASQPFSPAPYKVGERLTYNVSFSNFISAAHVELLVSARGMFFGREGIQIKGHIETSGVVNAALFAINNDYITYLDPATGLPYYGQQIIRETREPRKRRPTSINRPAPLRSLPERPRLFRAFTISFRQSIAFARCR
jgi:hypothetical protein